MRKKQKRDDTLFRLMAALILIAAIFLVQINPPAAEVKAQSLVEPDYDVSTYVYSMEIFKYFKKRGCLSSVPCGNQDWILKFTHEQLLWLRFFRIQHTEKKFLANTAAESWYNPEAISSAGCIGATQVCSITAADKELRSRGIDPTKLKPISLDAARGVAIYWLKLQTSKGEPWIAIKLYNGKDTKKNRNAATRHKNTVWKMHKEIF